MVSIEQLIPEVSRLVTAMIDARLITVVEIPGAIATVSTALQGLGAPATPTPAEPAKLTPAVPIRGSIKPDTITSLIDGKPYKTLKRHLGVNGYTPDTYRAAFGLPASYPMIAETYSARRREVAIAAGLGRKS